MMERVALSAGRCGSECVEYSASSILNATCALIDWCLSSRFNSLHTLPHENALSMAYYLAISLVDKVFQPCWDCFTSMTFV